MAENYKSYFLTEGQVLITTVPSYICTVLGSCVSVCLWDNELKMAGMNHYLMPGSPDSSSVNTSHGFSSIKMLIRAMINRGSVTETLEAKVFGGAHSLGVGTVFSAGKKNVEMARYMLTEAKVKVVSQNTGGVHGRKIIFNTATGKVKVHLLTASISDINEAIHKGFNY
jgi:chemotaxis protein CheD